MRPRRSVLALLLVAVLGAPAQGGEAEIKAETSHYLINFGGRTIGKVRRVLVGEEVDGRPRLTLATEEDYRFSAGGRPPAESSLRRVTVMKADWTPVSIEETVVSSGRTTRRSASFGPGEAVFRLPGGEEKKVPINGPVVAEMDGMALAVRGALKVGGKLTAAVPDLAQAGFVLLRASVLGSRRVDGVPGEVLLVEVKSDGGEQKWDLLVDAAGRLVEQSTGGMVRKRVDQRDAVLPHRPEALGGGTIPLAGAPARFGRLASMTIVVEMPEVAKGLVPELAGQRVEEAGRRITVHLVERHPDGTLPPEELAAADRARWLAPDSEPEWRDPEIRELAARITADAKGDLDKGFLLARWVHRNLVKSLGGPPEATARQALATRTGDCSEHAALFAALCRAAGLPARTAYGLAGSKGALNFHVWSEYYAGGRWIPLDAAMGRFGLPACYLTLSYDREDGGVRLFRMYAAARGRVVASSERPAPRRER